MGIKRKIDSEESETFKTLPVEVVIENLDSHPLCMHGPTLLFSSEKGKYYSCSSCRNKKDCTINISTEDWEKENVKKLNEKYLSLIPKLDKFAAWKTFNQIKTQHVSDRGYCVTCKEFYTPSQCKKHNKDHRTVTSITNEQLAHPSTWLPALENDTVEAQYLFSKNTVNTIVALLKKNNIGNILCIGTPSIHEVIQSDKNMQSILLDYDSRHHQFNQHNKFLWYNMFNNYLFNGEADKKILKKFIKNSSDTGLCVVMDPPFGGRVEPLVQTLQQLNKTYKKMCNKDSPLSVVWAFPYFSEPYIQNMLTDLQMHDYQVEYNNHSKFQNKKGRKFGSPVRLFTNLPLQSVDLSNDKNYRFCKKCKYWVSTTNQHCFKCNKCTSKNGMTYKHCYTCQKCVKPTFFHCKTCERCCQQKDHTCGVVVKSQSCYNCHEKGHKRVECPKLLKKGPKQAKKKRKQVKNN